jgi:tellurite resistance protein TehA-like permease
LAFTFPYAAGATDALLWLNASKPRGVTVYAVVVIVPITALIAGIAARTVLAAIRGQVLARSPQQPGRPRDPGD